MSETMGNAADKELANVPPFSGNDDKEYPVESFITKVSISTTTFYFINTSKT